MHPRALLTRLGSVLILMLIAATASAQSRFYVGGTAIADIRRFDSLELDPRILASLGDTSRDGTAAGGGLRVGTFLHQNWSLELAVDAASRTSTSFHNPIEAFPIRSSTLRLPEISNSTSYLTVSTVVGFHPQKMGRARLGYFGGLALVRGTYESIIAETFRTFRSSSRSCRARRLSHRPSGASGHSHSRCQSSPEARLSAASTISRRRVRVRGGDRYERSFCTRPRRQSGRVLEPGSERVPHQARSRRALDLLIS